MKRPAFGAGLAGYAAESNHPVFDILPAGRLCHDGFYQLACSADGHDLSVIRGITVKSADRRGEENVLIVASTGNKNGRPGVMGRMDDHVSIIG